MDVSEFLLATSRTLNKVLFSAGVASDEDVVAQWGTIAVAYLLNLLLVFVFVAAIFAIAGYYQPLAAPFAESALRLPVAIANLATFALTFIASLEWRMSDVAIERQRAANCSRGKYLVLVSLLSIVSLLFLVATFFFFSIVALVAGAAMHSALLHMLMSERVLRSA
jgi:hypothetical protein